MSVRTNQAFSPNAKLLNSFSFNAAGTGSLVPGWGLYPSAARSTRIILGGTTRLAAKAFLPQGVPVAIRVQVRASEALTGITAYLRPDLSTTDGQVILEQNISIPAGTSVLNFTGVTPTASPAGVGAGFNLGWSTGTVGSTLDITGIQIEEGDAVGSLFDGDTLDLPATSEFEGVNYAWIGAADASPSTATTTSVTDPPRIPEYPQGIRPIQSQELLTANRTGSFYYELRNRNNSSAGALDGVTPGGSLEFQYDARLKAGGKIFIADVGQDIDWLNQRIYIEAHVGDAAWGLGVYLPTAPIEAWANGHRGWDVELHSKLLVLDQDCISATYSLPANTNTIDTVRMLIESAGESAGSITDSTAKTPASMFWEAGTPKLTIINNLLDASGYFVLQVDGNGNFRALPYVTPAQRPVRYEFEDGVNCIYADAFPRDQDIFSVPNRVIAIQQGTSDVEGLVGVAENQDPSSPFSYPARGRYITRVYTGVEAVSQGALNTYAKRMLVDWSAPQAIVDIDHALVPLAIYDAVQFIYSLGELNARHVIDKTSVSLDPTMLAHSTLRQVVTYA